MFLIHAERRHIFIVRQATQLPPLSVRECCRILLKHNFELQQSQYFVQGVTSVLLFLNSTFSSWLDAGTR